MTRVQNHAPQRKARRRAQHWFQDRTRRHTSGGYDRRQAAGSQQLSGSVLLANYRRVHGQEAETMLDIGCGEGATLGSVAKAHPGMTLVGTDPVAEAVSAARRNVPSAQVEQISGALDGSFDTILIHLCLGLWDDVEAQLRHALRQLAPGGVLYVVDLNALDATSALATATNDAERHYLKAQYEAAFTESGLHDLLHRCAPVDAAIEVGTSPLGGYSPGSVPHMLLMTDPMVIASLRSMRLKQVEQGVRNDTPLWVPALLHGWVWAPGRSQCQGH